MDLKNYIRDVKDFPKKGIIFKDITPLLSSSEAFTYTIDRFIENIGEKAEVIVWLDARGFIFGGVIAYKLWIPFVPIRKKWKLPYETLEESYDLEYGKNEFEIHTDAIKKWQKVAIVDDLLATGGSMKASCNLIEKLGWKIISINFLIELWFLDGGKKLSKYTKNSLIIYD